MPFKGSLKNLIILIFIFLTSNQQAFAVFDGQIYTGKRFAKLKIGENDTIQEQKIDSSEKGIAFHLDPLPMVPVSFGGFYAMNDYNLKDFYKESFSHLGNDILMDSNLKGSTYGPEITAWLPYFDVAPYLRLSYVLGRYDMDIRASFDESASSAEYKYVYDLTGYQYAVGFDWSIVPTISLFAEFNLGTYKMKLKEVRYRESDEGRDYYLDRTVDPSEADANLLEQNFSSTAILVGLATGI